MAGRLLSRIPNTLRRIPSSHLNLSVQQSCQVQPTASHQANITRCSEREKLSWWEEATIYVHWPYCQRRCAYCNFNKYISNDVDQERMKKCLVKELQTLMRLSGVKRVPSVFFGGGTPSRARPDVLKAIIDAVDALGVMPSDVEISMEANPTSVETLKLKEFITAGVNRLSLGIQALNSKDLQTLGRDHTVEQSLKCIDEAKKILPGHINIDIMFGRPGQTLDSWDAELDQILDVCDDHISMYQLTLEPGTLLYKLYKQGALALPSTDVMAEMYEMAISRLSQGGFYRYEVSNFTKSAKAESRHNKAYWEGKQYIGVGPGAHGRFCPMTEQSKPPKMTFTSNRCVNSQTSSLVQSPPKREARIQTLEPEPWMREVEMYGQATRKRTVQSNTDILQELLLLGLRVPGGIRNGTWSQFMPGMSLMDLFGSSEFVKESIDGGLLRLDTLGMRCTEEGLNVLDSIVPHLLGCLDEYRDVER